MKLPLTAAIALAVFAAGAHGSDSDATGTTLVPNNHGGYNVARKGGKFNSIPLFGKHGYAAFAIAHAHDKPNYILVPGVEDVGHGSKIVVYKKVYFATPEEAEAAKGGKKR